MKQLKIFTGKQRDYNLRAFTLLYDKGPLSAWELTSEMTSTGKQSLHSTLNKRLRELERKDYIRRENKKWYLRFKGIIATLLILDKPRIWNPIWKEIYEFKANIIERNSAPLLKKLKMTKEDFHSIRKRIGLNLDSLENWIQLSKKTQELMEQGLMDFDIIKEEALFALLILQSSTAEQLAEFYNLNPERNNI